MKNTIEKFEELLNAPKSLGIREFEDYVTSYLSRKSDRKLALEELDKLIAIVQNHVLSLSIFLKQALMATENKTLVNSEVEYYTKQEVAIKYRVSIRTVTNWIISGLETTEIGGIVRISHKAITQFKETRREKSEKRR